MLSTSTFVLHLQESGASIPENAPDLIGGTGRVFMDTAGRLNLTEQGISAASITVRYRAQNSDRVWSNPFTLGTADKFRPGWFTFAPAGRGMAANTPYEYEIVTKDASGKELNHAAGTFTTGDANSVSALQGYKGAPVVAHFVNVAPETAQTMRLSYRKNGTGDAFVTIDVPRVGNGAFDWDTSALEVATSQAYEFKFDALAGDGRIVARSHGVLTVGDGAGAAITGYTSDPTPTLIEFDPPAGNGVATGAMKMVLQYRKTAPAPNTTPYTSITLTRTLTSQPFVLDASAVIPPGTLGGIDYTYTLQNASGATLVDVDGSTIQVSGQVVLGAADLPDTVTTTVTDATAVNYKIRRRQTVNAFGETIQEIDANDRVTDFTYNTLGRLIQKQDPETSVTLENGFVKRARPTTKYYYDALGRLVGTDDANGNRKTLLLAGGVSVGQVDEQGNAEALVYKEFHADGGVVENGYDVFGLKRFTIDELTRRTDYTYDAADRLTQVQRAARTSGSYNTQRATDTYAYDAAGNRISHTATPDGVASITDKMYYDALGRVTQGVSGQGRTTTMTYTWDASLKGAGGVTVGGWKKTTSNGLTGTKQNAADTSTTPTTISATVDAVNLFGQTVSHTDLGGHVSTYTYNLAGWLVSQSSTAGQGIGFEYYANGYIKKTIDTSTGAWTEYGYDKVGNRTYEAYSRVVGGTLVSGAMTGGTRVYEQNAKISYDELNRVKQIDDLRADIRYEYDAQSNRRRVWSAYQDGVYGYENTQEYWYTYDKMNRFLVTRGSLSARSATETGTAAIVATNRDGVQVAYDKAGQRTQAIYGLDGHREDYTYTADGLVENTYINNVTTAQGALRASRTNDLMGRVVAYTEYDTNGTTVTRSRTTTFDKDNRQTGQTETYKGATTTTTNTLLADGTLSQVKADTAGQITTTNYAYEWWDSAKQSRITVQAYNPALGMNNNQWKPGVSHYTYDVNGHVLSAVDEVGKQSFTYISNAQGQVMLREQRSKRDDGTWELKQTHRYYYAEGRTVGDVGNDGDTAVDYASQLADTSGSGNTYTDRQNAYKNWRPVSSADFDQNYQAITASYPGTAPGSYVVQAGDSLYSIAASQWGDASLWYLIAEANGLSGATSLTEGQTLSIPNKVTNVHNTSATSGVYDAGKTMGDTSPTIPDAPPPPRQDKGCGALAMIIVIVVAAVVTGGVGLALAGTSTGLAAAGAWAVAGAVGSIASQGVAMAMGVQQDFSWKAVGVSALSAAVTAGISSELKGVADAATQAGQAVPWYAGSNWVGAATRAAAASVVTQGVGSVLGVSSFSWKSIAASAAGAGMSTAMSDAGWMDSVNPFDKGTDASDIFAKTSAGMVNGGVQAGIFDTKPNWGSIAAQSFGQSLGDSYVESVRRDEAERQKYSLAGPAKAAGLRLGNQNDGLRLSAATAGSWSNDVDDGIDRAATLLAISDGGERLRQQMAQAAEDPPLLLAAGDGFTMGGVRQTDLKRDRAEGLVRMLDKGFYGEDPPEAVLGDGLRLPRESSGVGVRLGASGVAADSMGQPLYGRSNYDALSKLSDILASNNGEQLSLGRLYDWATYTVPDAQQRAAEINARYGLSQDPFLARIDGMIASPIGAVFSLGTRALGGSQEAQDRMLTIGRAVEGLAVSGAALGGRVGDIFNATRPSYAAPESPYALTSSATQVGRIDYSRGLANDLLVNFKPGYTRFSGTLGEDLVLVQFHRSDRALGKGRSAMWWTTPGEANSMTTIGDVRSGLALPPGWGARDAVSVARVPKGAEVEYYRGAAAPQVDQGLRYSGDGLQIRFRNFDPSWIVETRKIPGQP